VWPQPLETRWWIASWITVRNDLTVTAPDDRTRDLLQPFSSYVAVAHVELPGIGATTIVSMHASPNPVTAADLARWPGDPPRPRSGGIGVRNTGELFYSDLIVDALRQMADERPVLAAGDLNEARSWDEAHPGHTWGVEFFDLVGRAGLDDVTYGLWGEERRTRYHVTQGAYQLDYVLATPDISAAIVSAEVDAAWLRPDLDVAMVADHSPIWFTLEVRKGGQTDDSE
jgi:CO/xanthine dehydrogenase Mo-binding subunit